MLLISHLASAYIILVTTLEISIAMANKLVATLRPAKECVIEGILVYRVGYICVHSDISKTR